MRLYLNSTLKNNLTKLPDDCVKTVKNRIKMHPRLKKLFEAFIDEKI